MNYEKFLELVKFSEKISEQIKKSYLEKSFKIVNWKDECDFATEIDEKMEIQIAEKISELFPDHGIDGEELTKKNLDAENIWYIDPIDGTKYFASGLPLFTSSIGLRKNGQAVAGILINPMTGECVYGTKGFGCFKNVNGKTEKLKNIETEDDLSKAFVYFDTTGLHGAKEKLQKKGLEFISELMKKTYRSRNLGASCFMAFGGVSGHLGAFVDVFGKTKAQDIAAFSAILQELGYEERFFELEGARNYAIGNARILDQIEEIIEGVGGKDLKAIKDKIKKSI
ncbi:inositol monophosphatase [Candidatus Gracilibacteria bacterium]|nr:inositol monophosphatase [Candidatus Gracilibacteria bacterium]